MNIFILSILSVLLTNLSWQIYPNLKLFLVYFSLSLVKVILFFNQDFIRLFNLGRFLSLNVVENTYYFVRNTYYFQCCYIKKINLLSNIFIITRFFKQLKLLIREFYLSIFVAPD